MAEKRTGALHYYHNLVRDKGTWRKTRRTLSNELARTKGRRPQREFESEDELRSDLHRILANKILAAEIYPDRNPPQIIVAESEVELHSDMRAKLKTTPRERRFSGEVVILGPATFFSLDAVDLSSDDLTAPTETPLDQVTDFLLSEGYIPVDANFELIPLHIDVATA